MLLQSGIVEKIKNDVRWDQIRSSTGALLQIASGKTLKIPNEQERGLTLADTEGMFLLLGIGFVIAGGALVSEWVGGIGNKCMKLMKIKKEQKQEEHRLEEERLDEVQRKDDEAKDFEETERLALVSAQAMIGITFTARKSSLEIENKQQKGFFGSSSSRGSKHSRSSSIACVNDLSPQMLADMFEGPKTRHSNIVMMNGVMMSETEATRYADDSKESAEVKQESVSEVSKTFSFLNQEDDDEDEPKQQEEEGEKNQVCRVEINFQSSTPSEHDIEKCFGEKIDCEK
jgi:hypothetical protein